MWNAPVIIFDDEDEDELINEFVRLRATFPNRDIYEITRYIFRNLRDPELRSAQAAMQWDKDIAIDDRIANYNVEKELYTKEKWQAEILSISRSDKLTAQDRKSRLDGLRIYGEGQGWIVKAIDKTTNDRKIPPQIVSAIGDFHAKLN